MAIFTFIGGGGGGGGGAKWMYVLLAALTCMQCIIGL